MAKKSDAAKASLLARIQALPLDQKLMLAAQLMAVPGKQDVAIAIAEDVVIEYRAIGMVGGRDGL